MNIFYVSFLGSIIGAQCWSPASSDGAFTDPGGQQTAEAASRGGLSPTKGEQAETTGWKIYK